MAATSRTKSNKIDCVGVFPIRNLIASINAGTMGAQTKDPAIEVRWFH